MRCPEWFVPFFMKMAQQFSCRQCSEYRTICLIFFIYDSKQNHLSSMNLPNNCYNRIQRLSLQSIHKGGIEFMRSFTVYDIFQRNADIHGNRIALVCNENRITFSDLLLQVNALAGGMRQQGIKKGDRIAILSYNCHSFFLILGAAAACGAIVVAINWRLSPEEIRHILTDSSPVALCYDRNCAETVSQLTTANGYSGQIYCLENSPPIGIPLTQLFRSDLASSGCLSSSEDPFCIIYTAAIAGKSRGAVLTHANITLGNLQTIATMGLSSSDTHLNMLPLFHITGLNLAMSVMHAGGKNVVMDFRSSESIGVDR